MPMAKANNIDIYYETFGDPTKPAFLLIMGACCQGILYPVEFCQGLADLGYWVIRYDHRDTGFSTCFDYEKNPYELSDMAKDAIGLLNHLQIGKAHLVGLSLGGPIAEYIAVFYPNRVYSINLIATSAEFRPMNLAFDNLPEEEGFPSRTIDIYLKWMKKFVDNPPENLDDHIALRVEGWEILCGFSVPFEREYYQKLQAEVIQRMQNPVSMINHLKVCKVSEDIFRWLPSQVKVPTLIFHGTEDPIFPSDHGVYLANKIKNSKYFLIEGMGHVPHRIFFNFILDKIKCHY